MWFPWIALFGLFAIPTTFVYDVWDLEENIKTDCLMGKNNQKKRNSYLGHHLANTNALFANFCRKTCKKKLLWLSGSVQRWPSLFSMYHHSILIPYTCYHTAHLTARSDPWKPKITFLAKTHLIGLGSVENVIFSYFDGI